MPGHFAALLFAHNGRPLLCYERIPFSDCHFPALDLFGDDSAVSNICLEQIFVGREYWQPNRERAPQSAAPLVMEWETLIRKR